MRAINFKKVSKFNAEAFKMNDKEMNSLTGGTIAKVIVGPDGRPILVIGRN